MALSLDWVVLPFATEVLTKPKLNGMSQFEAIMSTKVSMLLSLPRRTRMMVPLNITPKLPFSYPAESMTPENSFWIAFAVLSLGLITRIVAVGGASTSIAVVLNCTRSVPSSIPGDLEGEVGEVALGLEGGGLAEGMGKPVPPGGGGVPYTINEHLRRY